MARRLLLRCIALCRLLSIFLAVILVVKVGFRHEPGPAPLQPSANRYNVNCAGIHDMDPIEVGRALVLRKKVEVESDESLHYLTSDCSAFLESRGYNRISKEESISQNFPLAYSLTVHKDARSVERLIQMLYTPSNIFCIHYDQKSPVEFRAALESLAKCVPNIRIASKIEPVYYATFSRLKADLNCISDLLTSDVKWKYVINLCGQDLPLRANIELVSELSKLEGRNMLETCRPTNSKSQRYKYHHELQDTDLYQRIAVKTNIKKEPPPHGIEMFTGSAYFVLSRELVEYMQTSDVVKDFLAWSEDTYSPDEFFWATLVRIPGVPGEVARSEPDVTDLMSKTRLVKWSYLEKSLYPPCTGQHRRSVCIYGVGELRWLLNYGHWFANKFDPQVDPVIIQCLEENLQKKQMCLQSSTV